MAEAEKETTKLNKKNLDYIVARSGFKKTDLEYMMLVANAQGRQVSVSYVVKEGS